MIQTPYTINAAREPRHLDGQRSDPHPCHLQRLSRQRDRQARWLRRWQAASPWIGGLAVVLMGFVLLCLSLVCG